MQAIKKTRQRRPWQLSGLLADASTNPLWSKEDRNLAFGLGWVEGPYVLRAYFPYKTRRPFSSQFNKESRYPSDNRPRVFWDICGFPGFRKLPRTVIASITPGHCRMHPEVEGRDTYPREIIPIELGQG